ncbi:MAG: spore cortex-lytic enzyme [Oscillospiraceae bacterium]|nr:spore cortex-lytic enzyme [Oscillospiraceae bacterium]
MHKKKLKRLCLGLFILVFTIVNVYGITVYKRGSRGEGVAEIQNVLLSEGLYSGSADGIYGSETEAAVRHYQERYGLSVDGIAGEKTLTHMGLAETAAEDAYANDLYLLARIISAEARGEPYMGQIAVGAVVLNRVKHPSFPNTIAGVIYQNGAFSALYDGQFNEPISEESRRAAIDALNGVNPVSDAIYYYNPRTATNKWIRSRPVIREIGGHVFCT